MISPGVNGTLLGTHKQLKVRKFCPTRPVFAPHALKGQKLLAQGNALGIMAISNAPCKGKSFKYCQEF